MKRNTKQLIPMILVFTIIAAGYSCRMLAMFDIGGAWGSYIRAALYLLLFSLWGYSLDRRIIELVTGGVIEQKIPPGAHGSCRQQRVVHPHIECRIPVKTQPGAFHPLIKPIGSGKLGNRIVSPQRCFLRRKRAGMEYGRLRIRMLFAIEPYPFFQLSHCSSLIKLKS